MRRDEFKKGQHWAYRETRRLGAPAERVELVAYPLKVRKVKVRWLEGDLAGLEEWVAPTRLLAPWKQFAKVVREEQRLQGVLDDAARAGHPSRAVQEAIETVFAATGEDDLWYHERQGYGQVAIDAFERLCDRAGLPPAERADLRRPPSYHSSGGELVLPWPRLAQLAEALAKAEPDTVTRYVDQEERSLSREGYVPGKRWAHDYLRERLPGLALVRHWAGGRDERLTMLEHENSDLRGLVLRAIRYLDEAGEA